MLIQGTDDFFYQEPTILGHRWAFFTEDDNVLIARKGQVLWTTARRPLAKAGVHCSLIQPLADRKVIVNEQYVMCSIFKIKLLKPIPPTDVYDLKTWYAPSDEEILAWT